VVKGVASIITGICPGASAPGRRGLAGVFAAAFYLFGAVLLVRVPALARIWSVDPADVAAVLAGWAALYAAAVSLQTLSRGRRALRGFDRRFRGNATAMAGLVVVLAVACAGILAPVLSTGDPIAQPHEAAARYLAPSASHPLGTDKFGRDVGTRVLYGARTSLAIALVSALLSALFGLVYGCAAGLATRRVDEVMMRLVDGLLAFPRVVFVLTLVALLPNSSLLLVGVIAATGWMGVARIVRGEMLRLRNREFVQAAVASGLGRGRLVMRHILPNAIGPVVVATTLGVGAVVLLESYLSFLGLGVQPPVPSWGSMVYDGRDVLVEAWWVAASPALAITLTVVAVNLIGDGLRDALGTRG